MPERPNILFITVDDMNWDAIGAYGCPTHDTTPNIDRLAAEGIRFNHAHVTIAVCQPSRSALMTGRYPHKSGGEGFFNLRAPNVPILPELLREEGYQVGILGKIGHSTPYAEFQWDMSRNMYDLGYGRNPSLYRQHTSNFLAQAKKDNSPFFLMLNSHDPHRPFYGNDNPEWYTEHDKPSAAIPSKTFTPEEITPPGFLPDLPDVRLEIAEYYNSVRRCDDTIGAVLDSLREAGYEDNTLVIFLSDNGMAFPFAKTNCYLNSTRTPWIMRWPKQIQAGRVDSKHCISGIDLMPTLLEAVGIGPISDVDGQSFLPVLCGEEQDNRELTFTQFHQTANKRNYPMRCVQNRRFGYIFNLWSNGVREFKNESQAGRTMNAMQAASGKDPHIEQRVDHFLYRVPEEFYDFENDPDALCNLIDDPQYTSEIQSLQNELESWMEKNSDPALTPFRNRSSEESREQFMQSIVKGIGGES